jgi:hydroxymethylbilane synthase
VELQIIRTTGDRIQDRAFGPGDGKGMFVAELERALLDGSIDLAVHSMKDLPGAMAPGLVIAAVPPREDPRDVLVARDATSLSAMPVGAAVGTSSIRRQAQLLAARADLKIRTLRGNIDTRLRKLDGGQYDVICLAAAGLHRLGLQPRITEYLDAITFVPAVGQGALALQAREDDRRIHDAVVHFHCADTARAVLAERTVLAALHGGCSIPLGAHAIIRDKQVALHAVLCSPDGTRVIREQDTGVDPEAVGIAVAERLRARGGDLLERTA